MFYNVSMLKKMRMELHPKSMGIPRMEIHIQIMVKYKN